MKTKFNSTFKDLLDKYNLPSDLNLNIALPFDIQQKLADNIILNDHGIGLESNWEPYLVGRVDEQSFHEDNENHFHVDWNNDNITDKKAFQLGIKTLVEFAKRFEKEKINNISPPWCWAPP